MDKFEVTQADREAWENYGPKIFHCEMTGPEAFARHRLSHTPQTVEPVATDVAALVEAAKVLVRALDSCVDLTPSVIRRVEKALAPFTKGQDDELA